MTVVVVVSFDHLQLRFVSDSSENDDAEKERDDDRSIAFFHSLSRSNHQATKNKKSKTVSLPSFFSIQTDQGCTHKSVSQLMMLKSRAVRFAQHPGLERAFSLPLKRLACSTHHMATSTRALKTLGRFSASAVGPQLVWWGYSSDGRTREKRTSPIFGSGRILSKHGDVARTTETPAIFHEKVSFSFSSFSIPSRTKHPQLLVPVTANLKALAPTSKMVLYILVHSMRFLPRLFTCFFFLSCVYGCWLYIPRTTPRSSSCCAAMLLKMCSSEVSLTPYSLTCNRDLASSSSAKIADGRSVCLGTWNRK